MITTVLVVDDTLVDRDNLSSLLHEGLNIPIVLSASTTSEMMSILKKNAVHLVFLDISFGGDTDIDTQGLDSINEIAELDGNIPIAIITGYYAEMVVDFSKHLGTGQIIHYLDKMRYDTKDIKSVLEKAEQFRKDANERINNFNRYGLFKKAFLGDNWEERIKSEREIKELNGCCNINGIQIWVIIEKNINELFKGPVKEGDSLTKKIRWIIDKHKLNGREQDILFESRATRNRFLHGGKNMTLGDARTLTECLKLVKSIS